MGDHDSLVLGLGFSSPSASLSSTKKASNGGLRFEYFEASNGGEEAPFLTLGFSTKVHVNKVYEDSGDIVRRASSLTTVSSLSSTKRERELGGGSGGGGDPEMEVEKVSSRTSDEDDDGNNSRKKLRLTKEQSALLEESFKHQSTLNPKQKQALARELNLRSRQVEVWFQNRRARTKLKQTEVDCEFLKKCCETLTDENRKLQKEIQELRTMKVAQPLYMQFPAATLTMCPSCERISGVSTTADAPHSPRPLVFFNKSSAAC